MLIHKTVRSFFKALLRGTGLIFLILISPASTFITQQNNEILNNQASADGIPINFELKKAGYVTLVIENEDGVRVRNLIGETWFEAGKNTVMWDGLDDLERDVEAAGRGVYSIPAKFVAPGNYKVRGLVHDKVHAVYEFTVYTAGTPPWLTPDHTGGWLANHSPPLSALFVNGDKSPTGQPVVYLGAYVTEGADGMAWVDLDGKKLGGKKFIGGSWTAAPYMAKDEGVNSNKNINIYVASVWETGKKSGQAELRITGITNKKDVEVLRQTVGAITPNENVKERIGGVAVLNQLAVVSLTSENQLMLINLKEKKVLKTIKVTSPGGLAFEEDGALLVLSGNKVFRFQKITAAKTIKDAETLISKGLESSKGVTTDASQNIYVSDAGTSNQVKVFTKKGVFLRAIGNAGTQQAGPYDPLHMNNPAGITIDSRKQLWVAENNFMPKRVSVWSLDGKFIRAFYGPAKYGGGGTLDPKDKNKFYYADGKQGTMEFALNWANGSYMLKNILYRKTPESQDLGFRSTAPETAIYFKGKRYFTNCYNTNPTNGHTTAFLFAERNNQLYPAAAAGDARYWDIFKQDIFTKLLPAGNSLAGKPKGNTFFIWNDTNADGLVQPNEVQFGKGLASGVTVMDDLSFCFTLSGNAVQVAPATINANGTPAYKINTVTTLVKDIQLSASSGGNQLLAAPDGWTVATMGLMPFHKYSISGAKNGKPVWSYPNLWPGLHASHSAPMPEFPGELIGPTRLLGGVFNEKTEPLWAINSNHGMVYIFTTDGFFVTTLFEPMRTGKRWNMPDPKRGMSVDSLTLSEENFWPTITQTNDGEVYLTNGGQSSLVNIKGLQSIKRLPDVTVNVSAKDIANSRTVLSNLESKRQLQADTGTLKVPLFKSPIIVDGTLTEWKDASWAEIGKGVMTKSKAKYKPFNVEAAVAVAGNRLYAAFKTGDEGLLKNSGEDTNALFKSGGALDIMIGAAGTKNRKEVRAGDSRLLVTLIKGKPVAMLYRAVVNGTKDAERIPFSSPTRTITFDKVEDITKQVEFAASKEGDYEISVPLSVLGLKPKSGMVINGDIGVLRGDGSETVARTYWHNKATAIVSDVPSEAELTPWLWGLWEFK